MQHHEPNRTYVARRTAEGKTKAEIIRCLKRLLAREIWAHMRPLRQAQLATEPGGLTAMGASTRPHPLQPVARAATSQANAADLRSTGLLPRAIRLALANIAGTIAEFRALRLKFLNPSPL